MKFPSVSLLLQAYQIASSKVKPSGKHNSLLKADIIKYINEHQLKPKIATLSKTATQLKTALFNRRIDPSTIDKMAKSLKVPIKYTFYNYNFEDAPLTLHSNSFESIIGKNAISYTIPSTVQTSITAPMDIVDKFKD